MIKTPVLLALLVPAFLLHAEEEPMPVKTQGARWLLKQQQPDGSFAPDVGITALAVTALAKSGFAKMPEVEKAIAYLLKHVHEDGSIYNEDGMGLYNYRTSVALMALAASDPLKYKDPIRKAQDYLAGTQRSEATGTAKDDPKYGGIGYGSNPAKNDMSNLQIALQALKESGYQNDEVFQWAAEFANHCQNHATNPLAKDSDNKVAVGDDGSFVYTPMVDQESSKAGVLESATGGKPIPKGYGSMTYAGLLTMVYAKLTKEDPRVSAAWNWIQRHYTLEDNPGMATPEKPAAGKQGLYYYYLTFAKAMRAYGEAQVVTPDKVSHRWAEELLATLYRAQQADGSWINKDSERWMEGNPVLATAYALLAIQICQEDLAGGK
jgi:squalene-hopene/tetraprenyl-beta-curcumene cyclase